MSEYGAVVVMIPCNMTYNAGEQLFKVIEESENYVLVEATIDKSTFPSAVHKDDCEDVWKEGVQYVKMYGVIR